MAAMVAALACIMALPTPAWATQPQENPKVTVNDSVVVFAGHEWWVVGDGTTGINQQPGNITLLAKEDVYGDSVFRQGHGAEFDGSQYDSENDMYYAAKPGRKHLDIAYGVRGEHAATGDGGYCRGIFRKRAGCHCGQSPARRRNGGSAKCRWHCRPGDRPKAFGSCLRRNGKFWATIPSAPLTAITCSAHRTPITAESEKLS